MLPWASARRLVVARGVEGLGAKQGESLAAYVRAPNPTTVLLLLAGQSLAPSHWLMQAVPAGIERRRSVPLAGRQLVAWLRARARADGFELDEDAAELLIELSGNDLTRLRGEVEKAALAGGPDNRRVGVAEVRAVVGEHRLRHIFDLTRALVRGRQRPLRSGCWSCCSMPGRIRSACSRMLGREVRALWQAAEGLRRGRREDEIARVLRRPPAAATAVIERARAMAPGRARALARRAAGRSSGGSS